MHCTGKQPATSLVQWGEIACGKSLSATLIGLLSLADMQIVVEPKIPRDHLLYLFALSAAPCRDWPVTRALLAPELTYGN